MKKINLYIILFLVSFLLFISGCTRYVCYDGSVKKVQSLCPVPQIPQITDQDAGRFVDNYGLAIADAKGDTYSRVNLYAQNGSWYSKVVFTNRDTQTFKEVYFKIDGVTGDVKCISGCEYLSFKK